jgi:hypothetical protein
MTTEPGPDPDRSGNTFGSQEAELSRTIRKTRKKLGTSFDTRKQRARDVLVIPSEVEADFDRSAQIIDLVTPVKEPAEEWKGAAIEDHIWQVYSTGIPTDDSF